MALMASLDSGISSLQSFARGMEVNGDNIANINTVGFKGSRTTYTDTFTNVLRGSAPSSGGTNPGSNQSVLQVGNGVQISSIDTNFGQGTIRKTGIPTDLAINGQGYFKVTDSISTNSFATRAGNFRTDDRDYIVTQETSFRLQGYVLPAAALPTFTATVGGSGELVVTQNAPATPTAPGTIGDMKSKLRFSVGSGATNGTGGAYTDAQVNAAIPTVKSFSFDSGGNLTYTLSDNTSFKGGQILLYKFSDPQALTREGGGLYSGFGDAGASTFDLASGEPSTNGLGSIQPSALEFSNVDLTQEFANVITTQRSFQAGARVISVSDEILNEVVNLKR